MLYWTRKWEGWHESVSRRDRPLLRDALSLAIAPDSSPVTSEFRVMIRRKEQNIAVTKLREETDQLEALLAASVDLAAELSPDRLCHSLVSHAIELTRSDAGCLYLHRSGQDDLELVVTVGAESSAIDSLAQGSVEIAEQARESQSPLIVAGAPDAHGLGASPTWAAVPLRRNHQLLGVLAVVARSRSAFSPDAMDLLSRLTEQASVAMLGARRYEETALRAKHLAIVSRIVDTVGKTRDLEDLAKVVYQEILAALEPDGFYLALYNEEDEELTYQLQAEDGTACSAERKPLGKGPVSAVLREREPLLIRDCEEELDQPPSAESWGTTEMPASWLGVPILVGDRAVGVICVQADRPRVFGEIEQALLTTIAEQVAVFLENTRLYDETSQRLAQTQVLRELMLAASSTLNFDLVLERTLEALHTDLGVDSIGFAMPDRENESLWLHPSQIGFPAEAEKVPWKLDRSICGRVLLTGEPLVIDDAQEHSCCSQGPRDTRSELAIPVGVYGQVAGVLNVASSKPNAFSEKDLGFYATIANHLSVALENARLFQAERRQRQRTEALEEAAAVVSGTLNIDQVLDRILEQVERVVTGDAFNVALIEKGDRARVVRRRGYVSDGWGVQLLSINDYPLILEMIRSGETIVVPDTAAEPRWVQEKGQEPWQSYVGAPIKVGGVVVGFLNVNSTRSGTFDDGDARRLQAFANHAATAIENAQLYQELHNYADALEERVEERTSQLRAQYAQLEAILDSTTDGIILAGPGGELVLANPVARNWLSHVLSPEESDQLREAVRALAARADGKPELVLELAGLDLQITAAPVRKPTTEDARAVVAIHDVSHLKALSRMKSRFVSNVSHELRTPIATIKLLAHLMQQQPDRWDEYLEPLTREAEHQANLVRDILEMSRVDAGRLEIRAEPTALNGLVEASVEKYESQLRERKLTLTCHLGEPDPVALADSQWMMQVLNNLLSNAVRYTPDGGTITVATGETAADGRSWATIAVTDTGIGIPDEELPHVFDRFFRGDRPRKMQVSGTGLGLAIVKEIVDLHGGRVKVESEVDEGSVFAVWLPRSPQ